MFRSCLRLSSRLSAFSSVENILAENHGVTFVSVDRASEVKFSTKDLEKLCKQSHQRAPGNVEQEVKLSQDLNSMIVWLSSINSAASNDVKHAMYTPLVNLCKSVPAACVSTDPEALLRIRKDVVASDNNTNVLMQQAQNKDRNYYVVPSNNGEEE